MAYRGSSWQQPRQDTGWGLIFRLNRLMEKIENDVEAGDIGKWNLHIDRLYVNIIYKDPGEYIYDEDGRVLDINFSKEDTEMFSRFTRKIEILKNRIALMRTSEDVRKIHQAKIELYNAILKKDIWIRKKMFELKLYLKEVEHDPRKAIYGG